MAGTRSEPVRRPKFHDYCLGGQLMLWASRHWMRAYRRGKTVPPCVWQSFAVSGIPDVYAELCGLLTIISFREFPASKFERPSQLKLSDAEVRFMEMLADVERGDGEELLWRLDDIATPAVARAIVAKSHRLLSELHRAGHRVANAFAVEKTSGSALSDDVSLSLSLALH